MQNCRRKAPDMDGCTDGRTAMAIPVYPAPLRCGGGMIISVEDHQIMLCTKYKCSSHYGLSEENFLKISFFFSM